VKRPLAARIQAKLANYRPVTPGGFFFGKCLGPISRAQRLAIFGDAGRVVSRMDPGQQRNRDAALWGNLVITGAGLAPQIGAILHSEAFRRALFQAAGSGGMSSSVPAHWRHPDQPRLAASEARRNAMYRTSGAV
jgi:hypothetical protein